MVPGQVQGGTRVVPVKCLSKGGGSRVLNYCKCLCCPSGCSGGRASARAQTSKAEGRRQNAERQDRPAKGHISATSEPP